MNDFTKNIAQALFDQDKNIKTVKKILDKIYPDLKLKCNTKC